MRHSLREVGSGGGTWWDLHGDRRAADAVWDQGEQLGGHRGAPDARTEPHQAGS